MARRVILTETRFRAEHAAWKRTVPAGSSIEATAEGAIVSPGKKGVRFNGAGVHTRNGDSIELAFRPLEGGKGSLEFGFSGGMESAVVTMDFVRKRLSVRHTDWRRDQSRQVTRFKAARGRDHVLLIEKIEGPGGLVKNADLNVFLDGRRVLSVQDFDIVPEIGVVLRVDRGRILLKRFVHRGAPSGIPEYIHLGCWQMRNVASIEENLASLRRGLKKAAESGVELLVTPETSLTGLFPRGRVTKDEKAISAAERRLRRFMHGLKGAPHLVAGLPVWRSVPGHRRRRTRYNASRVYAPDGGILSTHSKIHSCEDEFWHGMRLQEFDVNGAPVSMHICHDGRYPDVWTLPVMFGARLVLHPSNSGKPSGSIDAFEAKAKRSTTTMHAFYAHVNGEGGSYIAGPQKFDNLIAVSAECDRKSASFPAVGEPVECFFDAKVRLADAFGYWPVRSLRASEDAAASYAALYRALGGKRLDSA